MLVHTFEVNHDDATGTSPSTVPHSLIQHKRSKTLTEVPSHAAAAHYKVFQSGPVVLHKPQQENTNRQTLSPNRKKSKVAVGSRRENLTSRQFASDSFFFVVVFFPSTVPHRRQALFVALCARLKNCN